MNKECKIPKIRGDYTAGAIVEYKAPFSKEVCKKYGILPSHPVLIVGRERIPFRKYQVMCVTTDISHYTGYLIDLEYLLRRLGWKKTPSPSVISTSEIYSIDPQYIHKLIGYVSPKILEACRAAYAYEIGLTDEIPPTRYDLLNEPTLVVNEFRQIDKFYSQFEYVNDNLQRKLEESTTEDETETVDVEECAEEDSSEDTSIDSDEPGPKTLTNIIKDYINGDSEKSSDDELKEKTAPKLSKHMRDSLSRMTEDEIFNIVIKKYPVNYLIVNGYAKSRATAYTFRNAIVNEVAKYTPNVTSGSKLIMLYSSSSNKMEKACIRSLTEDWYKSKKIDPNSIAKYFASRDIETALTT